MNGSESGHDQEAQSTDSHAVTLEPDDRATRLSEARVARMTLEVADECGLNLERGVIEEIVHCRYVEPHEGRRPSYGAVIWPDRTPAGEPGIPPRMPSLATVVDDRAPIETLRRFADGRTSFVVRGPESEPALIIDPELIGNEQTLASYAQSEGVTVVQRHPSGQIRVFHGDSVYRCNDGVWLVRPTAIAYQESVSLRVDEDARPTAQTILDTCVHSLSPAGVGATLVWFPNGVGAAREGLDFDAAFAPPSLSVTDVRHSPSIVHALAQLDRAAVIEASGEIFRVGVALTHTEGQAGLHFEGGMRHESAGRFSALQPDALVFVVSADGPVTVFQDGEIIASTDVALRRLGASADCPRCGGAGIDELEMDADDTGLFTERLCAICTGSGRDYFDVEVIRSRHPE